jgi:hypothetical protein
MLSCVLAESPLGRSLDARAAGKLACMTNRQPYKFYAAKPSYFSAKVRPFFRYKDIPFEEIAPTLQAYREIIARTGLAFISVVLAQFRPRHRLGKRNFKLVFEE